MRPQELNLLVIFDSIMTEGSITRAADRLSMTQPAVSNAVSRMRVVWKDELFVKDGRKIRPTLFAKNLWQQIHNPLNSLGEAISPSEFDPSTAKRTFRIASVDLVIEMAWVKLRNILDEKAPNIDIYAVPYNLVNGEQLLEDAEVDLLITGASFINNNFSSEYLGDNQYVCAMRSDHDLAKPNLSIEEFAAADHLLISLSGDTQSSTDQLLANEGLQRRVAMTVNHFGAVSPIITNSNLIAVVPSLSIDREMLNGTIAVTDPPVYVPPNQISCYWHKRQERDEGLSWIRSILTGIIVENMSEHRERLEHYFCKSSSECT